MKKASLLFFASLLSVGVIAQTNPAAAPTSATTNTNNKAPKTANANSTGVEKKSLKKTGAKKTAHVTPVKKSAPADAKGASKEDLKK